MTDAAHPACMITGSIRRPGALGNRGPASHGLHIGSDQSQNHRVEEALDSESVGGYGYNRAIQQMVSRWGA